MIDDKRTIPANGAERQAAITAVCLGALALAGRHFSAVQEWYQRAG
ncbi:hypothetical protein GCM10007107_18430 [Shewanella indica]|nr:hypothetical protein GCM10007107_18430 [Shewanella indica]